MILKAFRLPVAGQNGLQGVFLLATPFTANGHFFHSTGIVPVKGMECLGTIRPVAL